MPPLDYSANAALNSAAWAVAEYLVRTSEHGVKHDPKVDFAPLANATGLSDEDLRVGIIDLKEAGLVEALSSGRGPNPVFVMPKPALFANFDRIFLGLDNRADAVLLTNWPVSREIETISTADLSAKFPDWSRRRLNSALNFIVANDLARTRPSRLHDWVCFSLTVTDSTHRFVHENS
jgi:hypothetical protein